jgi:iron complex outermembrane receptor protein
MPDTSKVRICVRTLLLLAGAALAFPAGPAQAQAADKADQPETPPKEIVVTGSALPTRLDQLAVPVSIVGADQIQKGGVSTNVLDILRKQIPAFAGRSNAGNSNATNNNQRTGGGS